MARNAEMIRQWRVLREIEASHGVTIRQLAELTGVTTRTIRRDLDALQEAGFALYDQTVDGRKQWRLDTRPFRHLDEASFTLGELSALYFSRTLVECLAGTPFQEDLSHAFTKLESALGTRMRAFLDRLPTALQAKPGPTSARVETHQRKTIGRLLDAILQQQRVSMRYHSFSSGREKMYRVDPYRLVYAEGSLYLFAYVPTYEQIRTFAVDRIRRLSPLEETFEVVAEIDEGVLTHSLGIHQGTPERVEIEFSPEASPYVEERIWHPSQSVDRRDDGSVVVSLDVYTDEALRRWILSFGSNARVLAPVHLTALIKKTLEHAHARYQNPGAGRKTSAR